MRRLAGRLRERVPRPVRASWAAHGGLLRGVAIAVFAGVGVALVEPYETGRLPLWQGMLYWCGLILAAFGLWSLAFDALGRLGWTAQRPLWVRLMGANLLMAAGGSVLTAAASRLAGLGMPGNFVQNTVAIFIPFVSIAVLVVTPIIALSYSRGTGGSRRRAPDRQPPFLERLPEEVRGRLLYLQAEDHYLRVCTDQGTHLMLMRLGDAVRELGEDEGLQCHRSFWVARDAVETVERNGRALALLLRNGERVPVSRSRRTAVLDRWGRPRPRNPGQN